MSNYDRFIPASHHPVGKAGDRLDREPYAETIYQILSNLQPQNSGLTIGIFGDWGIGKSSILKMVYEKVERDSLAFLPVWFEAWRFTKQEVLWLALLREIMKQIPAREGFATLLWVNWQLFCANLKWGRVILGFVSFLLSTFLFSRINVSLPAGPDSIFFTRSGFDRDQSIAVREFRRDFQTILLALNKKMVVLIDDLDRCPNNQIVPVLEAIKHLGFDQPLEKQKSYLNRFNIWLGDRLHRYLGINFPAVQREKETPNELYTGIAFVLAADRRAILQAIRFHYKDYYQSDELSAQNFAREYMEKIVQIPFMLPPLRRVYLEKLFGEEGTSA